MSGECAWSAVCSLALNVTIPGSLWKADKEKQLRCSPAHSSCLPQRAMNANRL